MGAEFRKTLKANADLLTELARRTGCIPFRLVVLSSNTATHLTDAICASALRAGILLDCQVVEYQEPEVWIAAHSAQLAARPPDALLLALDRRSTQLHQLPLGNPLEVESAIAAALARIEKIVAQLHETGARNVVVQTLAPDAADSQLSMDAWLPGSPRRLLEEFNLRLALKVKDLSCSVFDVAALANLIGATQWSPGRYWYVAKLPFAPLCIPFYAYRLVQLLASMLGKSRRVLILDLDNTLWGGVIGDDGVNGLKLGAGSARGEAHLAIQRLALQYKDRGIILGVASKNTEEIALEAFRTHPEMLLKESDVTVFQINWAHKPESLTSMANILELGLESFVFVDDNPVERKQMRDALPQVAVPDLPEDPSNWVPILQAAGYFEQPSFSIEDRQRTEYYRGNALRTVQASKSSNHEDFLKSLRMVMTVQPFDELGRQRITQLIAKSNQFNLTTRRYSEPEVAAFEITPDIETLQIRLQDIFGDNGMISVLICRKHPQMWDIDTWIMSCRVLGRGVEQAVLGLLVERARRAGALKLCGTYIPSSKNQIVSEHYAKLGFTLSNSRPDGATEWQLDVAGFSAPTLPMEIVVLPLTVHSDLEAHRTV